MAVTPPLESFPSMGRPTEGSQGRGPSRTSGRRLVNPVKMVVPTPSVTGASPRLASITDGLSADLIDLMRRLGGAWPVPLYLTAREAGTEEDGAGANAAELDARTADRLLQDFGANVLLALGIEGDGDRGEVRVTARLRRKGGAIAWFSSTPIVDGSVREARLVLASELLAATTSQPSDISAMLPLGTSSLEAWLLACEARYHRFPLPQRILATSKACEIDPEFAEAWLLRAELTSSAGDAAAAATLAEDLPSRFPSLGRAWLLRARTRILGGQRSAGAVDLARALTHPLDGVALLEGAQIALQLQDDRLHLKLLEKARDSRQMDPLLFDRLGLLRQQGRREVEAVALWERAYALSRSIRGLRARLALGHHKLGHTDRARGLFDEALSRDGRLADTHHLYGLYLLDHTRKEEALEHFHRAVRLDPHHPGVRSSRGTLLLSLDKPEEALPDLEAAVKLAGEGHEVAEARLLLRRLQYGPEVVEKALALVNLGSQAVRRGEDQEATPHLGEALRLIPDYWQAWFFLGIAHRLAERWIPAEGAFRQVLRYRPDQADAWNELSIALLEQNRVSEALDSAQHAHEIRPGDPAILSNLGVAWLESGNLLEARKCIDLALLLSPENPPLHRYLEALEERERQAGILPPPRPVRRTSSALPARAEPLPRVFGTSFSARSTPPAFSSAPPDVDLEPEEGDPLPEGEGSSSPRPLKGRS